MIVLALVLAAAPVAGQWQSYGFPGNDTCADWTVERASNRSQALQGWVLGFMSGLNAYRLASGGVGNGINSTAIFAWMDKRCETDPLEPVITAAFKLGVEIQKRERPSG